MRFIRDIIGEKRQAAPKVNGTAYAAGLETLLSEDSPAQDMTSPPQPTPVAPLAPESAMTNDAAPEEAKRDDAFGHEDPENAPETVTDDIAAFFARKDASLDREGPFLDEELSVTTPPSSEERPIKQMVATPMDPASAETGAQPDDSDFTARLDRALMSGPEPDQGLQDVFRKPQEASPPLSEPEASPQHRADLSQDHPRAEPGNPTAPAAALLERHWRTPHVPDAVPNPVPDPAAQEPMAVPQPAMGRGQAQHGRVKTRLLGFNTSPETGLDPISSQTPAQAAPHSRFPVGWLIVISGAGRGSAFTLFSGVSTIGRGEDQIVRLDFGDNAISRENHAAIAYDPTHKGFFIGHGGKANLVRRNDRPVLSTEELSAGDHITIGETVLRFVPFCGPDFSWDTAAHND